MTSEQRSEGLAAAARVMRSELIELADRALVDAHCELEQAPAPGSLMLEYHGDAGAFCFSEVVVTTAAVRIDDSYGWGCVLGYDREAALASAVADGIAAAPANALARDVGRLASGALALEREERDRLARGIARTKI